MSLQPFQSQPHCCSSGVMYQVTVPGPGKDGRVALVNQVRINLRVILINGCSRLLTI